MVETRPPRLDSLTGLRWWAAFAVFAHHMSVFAPLPIANVLTYGNYGVTFFFVLSGFVLTWSARPGVPVSTFWWRRFARIYPSHFVALILAIPVFYSFSPEADQWWVKPVNVGILLLSVVLVQGWSRDPTILFSGNPAAWTLTCEAFFYALHPVFHRFFLRLGTTGALVATVVVVAVAFAFRFATLLWPGVWAAVVPWPVIRLSEFVIGIGIARAMLTGWRVHINPLWCFVAGGAIVGWFAYSPRFLGGNAVNTVVLATANEWIIILCALTIAAVARRDMLGRRSLLRWRPLVILGEWSYAFYLVHATAIYAILAVLGPRPPSWTNLGWYAATLVVTLAAAAALHYLVERPCERVLRSRWDARQARAVERARVGTPA
ncbi:MAG: acyltransferase [Mycetocola sp.]